MQQDIKTCTCLPLNRLQGILIYNRAQAKWKRGPWRKD